MEATSFHSLCTIIVLKVLLVARLHSLSGATTSVTLRILIRRIFRNVRVNTNETKLHYSQFRFLHKLIASKDLPHAMRKGESYRCCFWHTEAKVFIYFENVLRFQGIF